MKTIIAGGRDYQLTQEDYAFLDTLPITEVVCGCARGADTCGENWGMEKGLFIQRFSADWDMEGVGAGAIRNEKMAVYADAAVLFPGGKGTADMRRRALKHGLVVHDRTGLGEGLHGTHRPLF